MYVVRYTDNPEADIQRGWSGVMGMAWETALDAAVSMLVNGEANLDRDEIEGLSDDELLSLMDDHNVDVRWDEGRKQYRLVHHSGLSCWRLEAETIEDAVAEAKHTGYWGGFGDKTIGKVTYVCSVPGSEDAHIFECNAVEAE
jgi:hypothetical protein